jgi:hypothetical protein
MFFRLTLTTLLIIPNIAGSPQPVDEYQVKAAYLYNFAKFVQWPPDAFRSANEPIALCVPGPDPFGRSLDDTVVGQTIEGRALIVRRTASVKEAAGCHVLFISSVPNKHSPLILSEIAPGILTILDSGASGVEGAVITFKLEGGKVRFEINVDAAERQKLRISSRLLNLAHIVNSKKK